MRTQREVNELKGGYTQVIIRQESPDYGCGAIVERTLILRNYSGGYVEISDGPDSISISPTAALEVARWIKQLPGLTPEEK
jgi:hypothetical protein